MFPQHGVESGSKSTPQDVELSIQDAQEPYCIAMRNLEIRGNIDKKGNISCPFQSNAGHTPLVPVD